MAKCKYFVQIGNEDLDTARKLHVTGFYSSKEEAIDDVDWNGHKGETYKIRRSTDNRVVRKGKVKHDGKVVYVGR